MKRISISIIALIAAVSSYAQDSDPLLKSWLDLKSQFLIKADAAKNIAILAMDSKKVDVASIEKIKGLSFGLNQVIKIIKEPDKPGVQRISQFVDSLDYYSAIIIKAIRKDQQFPSPKAYAEFEKTFFGCQHQTGGL